MAERPIFVSAPDSNELVKEIFFQLKWHAGFAPIQKERNIEALHATAAVAGYAPLLEISTKSKSERGQHLSAFHMRVSSKLHGEIPLECAFQGSKIFQRGGPFTELYRMDVRDAKRDPRLKESGALIGFEFDGFSFPLEPKTVFYDWLYVSFLYRFREWGQKLYAYAGFTDIEFNPYRSVNCQARSCALFLTLMKKELLEESTKSPSDFIRVVSAFNYHPRLRVEERAAETLFASG